VNSRTFLITTLFLAAIARAQGARLEAVASFPNQQITGVGVSVKSGRIFVNFPDWSDEHSLSVAEIVNGQSKPFPDEEWNRPGAPGLHFVCVQSVIVDDRENLWILDPAAPKMKEIVQGGPKLVKVDLSTNKVVQIIPFGEDIAPAKSYLNDVRIDTARGRAFMTESGKGALVVVDLKTGKARRLLDGHKSTQPEKEVQLTVDGKQLMDQEKKSPPQIAADGIALDSGNGYLYYHALTGHTLYRVKLNDLTDENLSKTDLESRIETVAQTPAPDGMLEGPNGNIYLTDLEGGAIVRWNVAAHEVQPIIADKRLLWPDTLSWGPKGDLYVTTSQIENMPRYNGGKSARTEPYKLWKVTGYNSTR
jgi:sugar lactone lactonase YvrE